MPLLFLLFPACILGALTSSAAALETRVLIEQYSADIQLLERHARPSPVSETSLSRKRQLLQDWKQRSAPDSFPDQPLQDQLDQILFRNLLESELLELDTQNDTSRELAPWLQFRTGIESLTDARIQGKPVDPQTSAESLAPLAESISKNLEALRNARKKSGPESSHSASSKNQSIEAQGTGTADKAPTDLPLPTPYQALLLSQTVAALDTSLKNWFENAGEFQPDFSWWLKTPYTAVSKALADYSKFLREDIAGFPPTTDPKPPKETDPIRNEEEPLLGRPVGAQKLRLLLDREFVPYTPEELLQIAEREFAWCETELRKAALQMLGNEDWKSALVRVKQEHVRPGEQEQFVRSEARRAAAFIKERQLITVPPLCEEWWGTQMLSTASQRHMPYAAYSGHDILIAYASASMSHDDKLMAMRGNNRHFTRNVVPHEFIPGHHLQTYMAERHRPYRAPFSTPFFVEGWALYWEMRLLALGYASTPEDRIGALFWRIHRCARILVTLRFHLGQIQPSEMVAFLMERVGHEKFGAQSEVRRFIAPQTPPLYQCGYMLGGLQILALHRELVISGQMTESQFHDALLQCGPIPVALARLALLGKPLSSTAFPSPPAWRFDSATP